MLLYHKNIFLVRLEKNYASDKDTTYLISRVTKDKTVLLEEEIRWVYQRYW